MATERTLSIIKPDATRRNLTGTINHRFESRGLRIVAQKRIRLIEAQAERFYEVHAERPFYRDLVAFMTWVLLSFRCSKERTQWRSTEKSWAQPILRTPPRDDPQRLRRVDRS